MCGGVGYKIKNIPDEELSKYYSPELIKRFKDEGRAESFFWHDKAVLPVKTEKGTQLKIWGNKDKDIRLPKTGWAREESIREGKWKWLSPEEVDILVERGCEKKTWFDLPNGTRGILVKRDGVGRVYMITKEASEEYEKETGHGREPLGEKGNYEHGPGTQGKIKL